MNRSLLASFVLIAACGAAVAHADFWQNVYSGLDLMATPTGSPVFGTGDGTRVNGARSGRLRIVPNGVIGKGYRLEFDRNFGQDSRGRPETLRFGCGAELTLEGAIQATAGYNKCGDFRCGFGDLTMNNLTYTLRTKNGAQDAELTGTFNLQNNIEINEAGFYNITLSATNTNSQFKLDGVVVRDEKDSNFDIGPIMVQGNLFYDGAVALLNALGVDTASLEELFPASPVDQINNAISQSLQNASGLVAGTSAENEMAPLLIQSVLTGNERATEALLDGLIDGSLANSANTGPSAPLMVPEPGTLLLFAVGGVALWYHRRRK